MSQKPKRLTLTGGGNGAGVFAEVGGIVGSVGSVTGFGGSASVAVGDGLLFSGAVGAERVTAESAGDGSTGLLAVSIGELPDPLSEMTRTMVAIPNNTTTPAMADTIAIGKEFFSSSRS
jgi:hypothetical protein